jgi:hypothetical protein
MTARAPMIDMTDVSDPVGKTVIDECGNVGTVIRNEFYHIVVDFDEWISTYGSDGYQFHHSDDYYIKWV